MTTRQGEGARAMVCCATVGHHGCTQRGCRSWSDGDVCGLAMAARAYGKRAKVGARLLRWLCVVEYRGDGGHGLKSQQAKE